MSTSKLVRSVVSWVAIGTATVACGGAGEGGIPGQPGPSGGAIASTGSGQNGASSGSGLPAQPSPGGGSGLPGSSGTTAGTGGGDTMCSAVCGHLATCGSKSSDGCDAGCPNVTEACRACILNAACDEITKCASACKSTPSTGAGGGPPASEGAGGSSPGTGGGSAQGGSSTTKGFSCHDLAGCCGLSSFPANEVMACDSIVSSGNAASCTAAYVQLGAVGMRLAGVFGFDQLDGELIDELLHPRL